jgi:ferredoxin
MAVVLTLLTDPRDPGARRQLTVPAGTTILKAAHDAGVDVTATCGGRGRCTSCRVKFVSGTVPPPTIMDEVQLGDDLVREGYRLGCQCAVTEPVGVLVAPPIEEHAFQILGDADPARLRAVAIDSGVVKQLVKVGLPREEHHQTSDLEELLAAVGLDAAAAGPALLPGLPAALREDEAGVTVTTFGGRIVGATPRCSSSASPSTSAPPPSSPRSSSSSRASAWRPCRASIRSRSSAAI